MDFTMIQGHRLGAANEEVPLTATMGGGKKKDTANLPKPRVDPKLTSTERDQQRAERLAAAEARQKKLGGKPKKKKTSNNAPLTGPNSKPLMTWTAG